MIIYIVPEPAKTKFPLGELYATANAEATLVPGDVATALARHHIGDWGDLDAEDKASNEAGLLNGERLLSAYHDSKGVKFWIITERDRSVTTVLLPEDY